MYSLAAFSGFLIVLLLLFQYYFFCILILPILSYLALLEYKSHHSHWRYIVAYLFAGIASGAIFGVYTFYKYNYREISEPMIYVRGQITSIGENSIIVEVKNFQDHIDKIRLSRRGNESFDPFLFDQVIFSCKTWRKNPVAGIFGTLEKLQGIHHACKEAQIHSILENSKSFNDFRRVIRKQVRQSLDLLGNSSFARGFILNDTRNIHPVEVNLFRKMGIAHLFSASGLHMGLLYTTCYLPFAFFGFRKTGYTLALFLCFMYLCVLDFSIPLLRSYIFLALYIILKLLKRKTNGKYILYFSIILLEIIFPLSCFSASFILSFLITLMILLYFPQFKKIIMIKNNYLKDHLALTISASLGSCFLSVFLFNYYHPVSMGYNLILVPLSGIYLASIFLYLIFPVFKYIIISGDFIFRQACWIHYLVVEKYIPENHAIFTNVWIIFFFCLTIYFVYFSYKQKYWYLRKYYLGTYVALSMIFLSNYLFLKIPDSTAMAFPFGIIQYKNRNYYITGNINEYSKENMKYVFQKMNWPFRDIYASDNFIPLLHDYKVHEKFQIKPLEEKFPDKSGYRKARLFYLNEDCFFFIFPKRQIYISANLGKRLSMCKNIYMVHSKNYNPDKTFIKKLFSRLGLSTNVHYMNYYNWQPADKSDNEKKFF